MVIDRPRIELPGQFGMNIFSGAAPTGPTETNEKAGVKESIRVVQFTLNAIIMDSNNRRLTIINNTILKVGDMIQGAQVTNIVKSKVLLTVNKKTVVLSTNSRVKQVRLVEEKGE